MALIESITFSILIFINLKLLNKRIQLGFSVSKQIRKIEKF